MNQRLTLDAADLLGLGGSGKNGERQCAEGDGGEKRTARHGGNPLEGAKALIRLFNPASMARRWRHCGDFTAGFHNADIGLY
jgi:hypothetical protein